MDKMTDEEKEQKLDREIRARFMARNFKNIFLRVEIIIGILSMIAGVVLTIMVWGEGFFPGALMLVMTGLINVFLAGKELIDPSDNVLHWLPLFFLVVRRAMFFLNVVLLALVFGTMTNLIQLF